MQLTTTIADPTIDFASSMATPSLSSAGPYYVVLGGDIFGIHEGQRPPNTALGTYLPLLPIVVCCPLLRDAESINRLNAELFVKVAPDDAYTLMQHIQWDEGPVAKVRLSTPGPYYAIRSAKAGKETGVWLGYPWGPLAQNVGKEHAYHRFETLQECLAFMVEKYDYNLPLLPQGQKLPPPIEPLSYPRSASLAQRVDNSPQTSVSTPRQRIPPAVKREHSEHAARSERAPSPDKREQPVSPTKSSRKRVTVAAPSPHRSPASPISSTKTPGRSGTPIRIWRRSGYVDEVHGSPTEDPPSSDGGSEAADGDTTNTQAHDEAHHTQFWIDTLRRLVRMPADMVGPDNGDRLPVNLGPVAENMMLAAGASAEDAWAILQIRVHARSPEAFTHHVGLQLGWPTRQALALWHAIQFPRI
ncbi:hypothetical protein PYCCODRAFT_1463853 [Trametes coccinea BRFM310]|uniref:Uncharacterized protein n=1 Tax=Trametes coccinea (strain BRFM310) TaxID=1353009 RepID=A0A1Y2J2K3_TRAC3|nr:hypothetical protein PYCCODRAFT_1463853 [Trametes coccinea BRFM310]